MSLIKDKSKPSYKWILLGPKRSGSGIHIDPFKTSAWNILFSGKKRWIMIKENVHKDIITPTSIFKYNFFFLKLKINNPLYQSINLRYLNNNNQQ